MSTPPLHITSSAAAAAEMNRLLASPAWLASYASNVDAQNLELSSLQHGVDTLPGAGARTTFGSLKIPVDSGDPRKYSKMLPSENLGGIYGGLQLDQMQDVDALPLPTCQIDCKPFINLCSFATPRGKYPYFDAIHSPALRGHLDGSYDSVSFIVKHITRDGASSSAATTPIAELMTTRATLNDTIVKIENMRTAFITECKNITPRLKAILEGVVYGTADSDHDDSDSSEDSCSEHNGQSEDDEKPIDPSPKRRKTYDEIGTNRDTPQQNVKITCEVKPARGLSFRTREFKNSTEPHIAELFLWLARCEGDISKRLTKVTAPAFSSGAEMTYERCEEHGCRMPKDLRFPSTELEGDTIITAKMIQMPEGPSVMRKYVEVQRMAAAINAEVSSLFDGIRRTFGVYARFNFNNGTYDDVDVTTLTTAQLVALGKVYIDTIKVSDGADLGEQEAASDSEELASASEDEGDSSEDSDDSYEDSGEDSGEESDDEESDDEESD